MECTLICSSCLLDQLHVRTVPITRKESRLINIKHQDFVISSKSGEYRLLLDQLHVRTVPITRKESRLINIKHQDFFISSKSGQYRLLTHSIVTNKHFLLHYCAVNFSQLFPIAFSETWVPNSLLMRTKSQGTEVIQSTY